MACQNPQLGRLDPVSGQRLCPCHPDRVAAVEPEPVSSPRSCTSQYGNLSEGLDALGLGCNAALKSGEEILYSYIGIPIYKPISNLNKRIGKFETLICHLIVISLLIPPFRYKYDL